MKVKFNIKNVHYATKAALGGAWDTPARIPGAVNITLEQKGELTSFYADGVKYYTASSNSGYEGDLETALIPDDFREKVLKEIKDKNGVLIENADAEAVQIALGFEIDGDEVPTLFWFYNVTATRPSIEAKTNTESKEPNTDKIKISCAPNEAGDVRAKTTKESYAKVKDTWFTKVYEKDATLAV